MPSSNQDSGKPFGIQMASTEKCNVAQIDRKDMSKTQSKLFRMSGAPSVEIPDGAWIKVGYTR